MFETVVRMLSENKEERISIDELKAQSRKLMETIKADFTMNNTDKNIAKSNIHKAHQVSAQIKSVNTSQ